ncbi:MAG TPA: D-alanine--D-alanine ligase, partial [Phycisphaerae bacterium]|nr:D-alanine--D-alanine ligase [Phycisphaerae bacterium]
ERCEELCRFPLAPDDWHERCAEISLAAWRALDCRDAGRVDLRADADGNLQVMELNPLPGLHPWHSDLPMLSTAVGVPYVELINRIVTSALARVTTGRHSAARTAAVSAT